MIRIFRGNGSSLTGVVIPSLILFFLILLCFSLPAISVPSRPLETKYNLQNTFPEKIFLNIDNGLLTLIARNSSLGPIMEEIGRRSGVKIKVSPSLRQKKIDVNLRDIPIEKSIKKIAGNSNLIFDKDEDGNFYLSESHVVKEPEEQVVSLNNTTQTMQEGINTVYSISSGPVINKNEDLDADIPINEMVIRFKQGIPENEINQLLSDANIKVKEYIASLKYHILSLPEGMTSYDAMVLFKSKKILYQSEPKYLIPVK